MTIDYATIVTDMTTAATPAVAAGVGFMAVVLAVIVGVKLFKRFSKGA